MMDVISVFLFFIIFQNIILSLLPAFFGFWDECFTIICFFIYIVRSKNRTSIGDIYVILLLLASILTCLLGNFIYGYQSSIDGCIRDILGYCKFPIVFLCLSRLDLKVCIVRSILKLIPVIKAVILLTFAFGLISFVVDLGMTQNEFRMGIHPYYFIFSHPTYLTTSFAFLLCVLNASKKITKFDEFLILSCILMAMRTKGVVFIFVYIFIKYFFRIFRNHLYFFVLCILLVVLAVSYQKLQLYSSYSNSPRESLYKGAIELFINNFPFGSGFCTFASHVSGKFYSYVYYFIHIAGLYDEDGNISADIGDAGLPYYIGQFGVIGSIFVLFLFIKIFLLSTKGLSITSSVYMLWALILISIPSEAILVNDGAVIGTYLIILISLEKSFNRKVSRFIPYM